MAATESDPIALRSFVLLPEPVPSEVLGVKPSMEVRALRLSGVSLREAFAGEADPHATYVETREFVFAVPRDVMEHLARTLTEACEQSRDAL
jgi:hypothetical protein